jgi:hypothetical protein
LPHLLGQGSAFAQASYDRLVNAAKEPANSTYAGDYTSQRYTQLDQINTQTLQLKPALCISFEQPVSETRRSWWMV